MKGRVKGVVLPTNMFPFHCLRFTDLRPEVCKFRKRGCLIKTWGLKDAAIREKFVNTSYLRIDDPSVFPVPLDKYKNGIEIADTKLIVCSNTECTRVNDEGVIAPTTFHYCCYANMCYKESISDIKYCNKDECFTEYQISNEVDGEFD